MPESPSCYSWWQKFLLKCFPNLHPRISTIRSNIENIIGQEYHPWHAFPRYLLKTELQEKLRHIKSLRRQIMLKRFWLKPFFSDLLTRLAKEKTFFHSYISQYLQQQMIRHRDFFLGKETGDSFGLNPEQIRAILINERENLLVAGPGSGKTRVIMDRVGFYHLKRDIPEDQILVLAFNRTAAEEVKSRIHQKYGLSNVEIRTFHSLGMKILRLYQQTKGEFISVEANANQILQHIISQQINQSSSYYSQYFAFFGHYLKNQDFHRYHDKNQRLLEHKKHNQYYTLNGEQVKSLAECDIANFFLIHGIEYEYEILVKWCDPNEDEKEYHPDFYLPTYDVYLEHWAFKPGKQPPDWFDDDENLYEQHRQWKLDQFRKHGKTLWHTYYEHWREGTLETVLRAYCLKAQIPLKPLNRQTLMKKIGIGTQNHHLLSDMISSYIIAAKNCGFSAKSFQDKVDQSQKKCSAYDLAFFQLVSPIFAEYHTYLRSESKIDFNDMINQAVQLLKTSKLSRQQQKMELHYAMIFVDEFQDISPQRFQLLQQLMNINPQARLFCVGDDWQAIYGFTGATNRYLTDYQQFFSAPVLNFLNKNYRNTGSILNYGTSIIEQTSDYIDKKFEPNRPYTSGSQTDVSIHTISSTTEDWFQHDQYHQIYELLLELIKEQGFEPAEILVLSRYNFGYTPLQILCEEKEEIPVALIKSGAIVKPGVRFYTLHKSKGLEADVVIILNLYEGDYGFPSTIESKVNYRFLNPDLAEKADEEARLCFVGLTRARKQVYLFTWKGHESSFILTPESDINSTNPLEKLKDDFTAAILTETSRAYLFLLVDFKAKPKLWFPKSTVIALHRIQNTKLVKVKLKSWILESKNKELNQLSEKPY